MAVSPAISSAMTLSQIHSDLLVNIPAGDFSTGGATPYFAANDAPGARRVTRFRASG